MACDLCGAKGTPLANLLDGYKTEDIKAVCPACEKELNAKLWKIRAVLDGSMRTLLKRWMGEKRAAVFTDAAQHTLGAPANCPACKAANAGGYQPIPRPGKVAPPPRDPSGVWEVQPQQQKRRCLMRLADEYAQCWSASPLSEKTTAARRALREAVDAAVNQQLPTDKESLTAGVSVGGASSNKPVTENGK
jgi:hypothetical protein